MSATKTGGQASLTGRKIDYEAELNAEQLRAVREGDGPCLVLAGAGSGKTRTVTYRVAWLLEHGVPPERILLLTFTNKAATEMLARVERLLGHAVRGIWGGTFHSVANRILRVGAAELGFTPGFTILDADDAKSLLKQCVKERRPDRVGDKSYPSPAVIADTISYARNARVGIAESLERKHPDFEELDSDIAAIASEYAAKKKAANSMDFDDLLAHLLELLTVRPLVARALSEQFEYVLVDEYQDTNPIQAEIVDRLSAAHRNLLVVGDDAQSIYSFRAATVENILSFPERYPGAKVFRLETNYRSTPEILELANDVIRGNSRQFAKELRPVRSRLARPTLAPAPSSAEEARSIVSAIAARSAEGVPYGEMAVLFRATHHSQELEFELARQGIAYDYRGGMKFFERSHVKDVVSFVKLKANPKDAIAWQRVLELQQGIGETGAQRLSARFEGLDSLGALDDSLVSDLLSARSRAGWDEVRSVLMRVQAAKTPADAVRVVVASGYRDRLIAEYPNAEERLGDLEQFARFAETYSDLAAFLAEVTLKDDYGPARAAAGEPKLVLSTVHQAKGLEWDTVFLMRLANGSFPHIRSLGDEEQIEEERRLFYVAVTRARNRLVLTYPVTSGYDSFAILQPSQFLTEISDGLLEERRPKRQASYGGYGQVYGGGYRSGGRSYGTSSYSPSPSKTVWSDGADEVTADDGEATIELDEFGEAKKPRKRGSLLRGVDEL